jgi:hypothetical protein
MFEDFGRAIYTLLSGEPNIATLTQGRIYENSAPVDAITPYVIFTITQGKTEPLTFGLDTATVFFNVGVTVNEDENGGALATQVADHIRNALHRAEDRFTMGKWDLHQIRQVSPFNTTQFYDGRAYQMAGGTYQLEADQKRGG